MDNAARNLALDRINRHFLLEHPAQAADVIDGFGRAAAKTRNVAAQRQPSAVINVHARAGQRRARSMLFVDVVVTNVDADIHFEDAREKSNLVLGGALLFTTQY